MEEFFDIVENFANPQRELLKHLGKKYGLRQSEVDIFETLYPVWKQSNKLRNDNKQANLNAVAQYFPEMRRIAEGNPGSLPGADRISRKPVSDKYVIFSDHHMLHRGHRHDYFFNFHNQALYRKVLDQYATCDFTLVENGDVEELLIMEPSQLIADSFRNTLKNGSIDEPLLNAMRTTLRMNMLDRIITDNEPLYDQINAQFHQRGKYIRLSGNHDTYFDSDLERRLRQKYSMLQVRDVLALHPMSNPQTVTGNAEWLVTHGHQFDTVTCPLVASLLGELNSETLSWIYEGPDRKWDWNDDVNRWIAGTEVFRNRLASGHPEDTISLVRDFLSEEDGSTKNAIGTAIAELAMEHEIAWEYFESATRWDALANEVLTGNEFFKIRHLSEEDMCRQYEAEMWNTPVTPTIVVGHTHEPRHHAVCSHNLPWSNYMNSGSAGRFENLIFAVEVENGVGKVVSWHNDTGPSSNPRHIQRRVWTPDGDRFRVGQQNEFMCQSQYVTFDPGDLQSDPPPYMLDLDGGLSTWDGSGH